MTWEQLLCDATADDYAAGETKVVLRKMAGEAVSFAVAMKPRMVQE